MYKQSLRRKSKDFFKTMFHLRFLLMHFILSEWPFKYLKWTYCVPIIKIISDIVISHACFCSRKSSYKLWGGVFVMLIFWNFCAIFLIWIVTAGFYYVWFWSTIMITLFLLPIQQYPCHFQCSSISNYFKVNQQMHIPDPIHCICHC